MPALPPRPNQAKKEGGGTPGPTSGEETRINLLRSATIFHRPFITSPPPVRWAVLAASPAQLAFRFGDPECRRFYFGKFKSFQATRDATRSSRTRESCWVVKDMNGMYNYRRLATWFIGGAHSARVESVGHSVWIMQNRGTPARRHVVWRCSTRDFCQTSVTNA